MAFEQLVKPQNRVERGSQFVAYARQKLGFGEISAFGFGARGLRFDFGDLQSFDVANALRHVEQNAIPHDLPIRFALGTRTCANPLRFTAWKLDAALPLPLVQGLGRACHRLVPRSEIFWVDAIDDERRVAHDLPRLQIANLAASFGNKRKGKRAVGIQNELVDHARHIGRDAAIAPFALAQCFERFAPVGDVALNRNPMSKPAFVVGNGCDGQFDPKRRAALFVVANVHDNGLPPLERAPDLGARFLSLSAAF